MTSGGEARESWQARPMGANTNDGTKSQTLGQGGQNMESG